MTVCDRCGQLAMNTLTVCQECHDEIMEYDKPTEQSYDPEPDWDVEDDDDEECHDYGDDCGFF